MLKEKTNHIAFIYCAGDVQSVSKIHALVLDKIENIVIREFKLDSLNIETENQIISIIDESDVVLFIVSQNAIESKGFEKVIRYVIATNRSMVPISIGKFQPTGWLLFNLSGVDIIDFENEFQRTKLLENVLKWSGHQRVSIESNKTKRVKLLNRYFEKFRDRHPAISVFIQRMSLSHPITNIVLGLLGLRCITSLISCVLYPLIIGKENWEKVLEIFSQTEMDLLVSLFLMSPIFGIVISSICGLVGLYQMYIKHVRKGYWILSLSYYTLLFPFVTIFVFLDFVSMSGDNLPGEVLFSIITFVTMLIVYALQLLINISMRFRKNGITFWDTLEKSKGFKNNMYYYVFLLLPCLPIILLIIAFFSAGNGG